MNKLVFATGFAALTLTTPIHAETVNCTAITALPYTITTQGVYCLTGHLSTTITGGSAITINTSNVVLDLNGFKLGGLAAGQNTNASGIFASQKQNITIRNGTVRGFAYGINLTDASPYTTSAGHVIEDIRADLNTYIGLWIFGKGNIIRNNQVVATGGTTLFGANAGGYAIAIDGPGARLLNNDVSEVTAQGNGSAYGVQLFAAPNSVVASNRIGEVSAPGGTAYGIFLFTGSDFLVSDNRLTGTQQGINFNGNTGKYMNNMTQGVTTPYTGGTAAGATNF